MIYNIVSDANTKQSDYLMARLTIQKAFSSKQKNIRPEAVKILVSQKLRYSKSGNDKIS